jgi:hypothetical protein
MAFLGADEDIFVLQGKRNKDEIGHRLTLFGWSAGRSEEKQGHPYQAVNMIRPFKTIKADFGRWLLAPVLHHEYDTFLGTTKPIQSMPSRRKGNRHAKGYKEKKPNIPQPGTRRDPFKNHPQQPSRYSSSTST